MAIKLGELLVKANLLQEAQLKGALAEQAKWGGKLGEILVRMNFCTEDIVVKALAKQLSVQRADLDNLPPVSATVLAKIPKDVAGDLNVLPLQLRDENKTLVVAMANPLNLQSVDALRSRTGCRIVTLIAGSTALARARARLYEGEEDFGADEEGGGLKFTDAQGNTLVKKIADIKPPPARATPAPFAPPQRPSIAPPAPRFNPPSTPAAPSTSPQEILAAVEAVQRKEVAALKAMVEILIEKGVFTREEYLARVKR